MMDARKLVTICAVCVALGWFMAGTAAAPAPQPAPQPRPALRWIARIAKTFLWVALVAEPAPAAASAEQFVHMHRPADGIEYRGGW